MMLSPNIIPSDLLEFYLSFWYSSNFYIPLELWYLFYTFKDWNINSNLGFNKYILYLKKKGLNKYLFPPEHASY